MVALALGVVLASALAAGALLSGSGATEGKVGDGEMPTALGRHLY